MGLDFVFCADAHIPAPSSRVQQFVCGLASLSLSFAAKQSSWPSFPSSVTLDSFQRMGWPQMTHFNGGSSRCIGEETRSGMGETFFSKNYLKSANTIGRSSCFANVIHFLFAFRNVRLKHLFGFIPTRKRSGAWNPFPAESQKSECPL